MDKEHTASCELIFNPVKSAFLTASGSFTVLIRLIFVSCWKVATECFTCFYPVCCDLSLNSINYNAKVVPVVDLLRFWQLRFPWLIYSVSCFSRHFPPPAAYLATLLAPFQFNSKLGASMPLPCGGPCL